MTLEFQVLTWYMHTYVTSGQQTYVASGQKPICGEWANTHMWRVERHTYAASGQTHTYGNRKCNIHIVKSV